MEPDWLLIYRIQNHVIRFGRTGTHSDLALKQAREQKNLSMTKK